MSETYLTPSRQDFSLKRTEGRQLKQQELYLVLASIFDRKLRRLLLLSLRPRLSLRGAARAARVPGPDAGADLVRVVQTLRAAGRTPHAVQTGVEDVALEGILARVHAVLSRAMGIS